MSTIHTQTRQVFVGGVPIGAKSRITVQSMTTTKTENYDDTIRQIHQLEEAGCDIIRVTVPSQLAAENLTNLVKNSNVPIVADIHFDYRLALKSVDAGVQKIRINPGNIGKSDRVKAVLDSCKSANVPIRIGVNAGSLEKDIIEKYGYPTAEGMLESASRHIQICEENGFQNLIVSLKSSDVSMMIRANRMFAEKYDIPLHLGVTEAGPFRSGTVKSAVGIGTLLADGIGDTIRVSLTDDPVREVEIGQEILKSLGYPSKSVTLISCPTCGRLEVDLIALVLRVEEKIATIQKPIKVALMGCAVNGPGEAKDAHLGIACGKKEAVLYRDGKAIGKIPEDQILEKLMNEIENYPN